jgi:hypothetical protein
MDRALLLGVWRYLVRLPRPVWQGEVAKSAQGGLRGVESLSEEARGVRNFVVLELPRAGAPLSPERIAQGVGLPVEQVVSILGDLERGMTYLYRNDQGHVSWAYPVTVDPTPHRVTFSSGEQLYAA